jgi:hypothetical protein
MPKAKPKTKRMWMGWTNLHYWLPGIYSQDREKCQELLKRNKWDPWVAKPVRVRIVPEAEYQRMRAASKRKDV